MHCKRSRGIHDRLYRPSCLSRTGRGIMSAKSTSYQSWGWYNSTTSRSLRRQATDRVRALYEGRLTAWSPETQPTSSTEPGRFRPWVIGVLCGASTQLRHPICAPRETLPPARGVSSVRARGPTQAPLAALERAVAPGLFSGRVASAAQYPFRGSRGGLPVGDQRRLTPRVTVLRTPRCIGVVRPANVAPTIDGCLCALMSCPGWLRCARPRVVSRHSAGSDVLPTEWWASEWCRRGPGGADCLCVLPRPRRSKPSSSRETLAVMLAAGAPLAAA